MMATVPATREGEWQEQGHDLHLLYREHRWSLVRLASLLLCEPADAEEVVQEAFVKVYLARDRLRDPDKALAYVRSAVLNGARSRLRHLRVVGSIEPAPARSAESAESEALGREESRRVMAALMCLPVRQRECLALRYYLDLSEAEIATTLGISSGSVKTHVHRGLAALATRLERTP
jgi:RNA polymerase sigma-70 factor (sigma-E family)